MMYFAKKNDYTYGENIYIISDEPDYSLDGSTSYLRGVQVLNESRVMRIVELHHPNMNEERWDGSKYYYPQTPGGDEWSHTYNENKWEIKVKEEFLISDACWETKEYLERGFDAVAPF